MNLGGIWEWEKLKLSSDIDFSEKSVGFSDVPLEREEEDEDLPPAIKAQRRAAASLGAVKEGREGKRRRGRKSTRMQKEHALTRH